MRKSIFDRAIEVIAPTAALKRYAAKARLSVAVRNFEKIEKSEQRKYDAATKGRHYSDWYSPNLSVNQEVLYNLALLRDRSRDLGRNNAYAINAVRTIVNNVIGIGILPNPKGLRANQAKTIKELWDGWGGKTECDYDGNNIFAGLQQLALKTVIESGECLIRKVRGTSDDKVPLRIQLLEGDFINTAQHTGIWQTDNTITYYGIKFDRNGRRLGYWLFKHHPNEFGSDSEFVPASDIIHLYDVERPGQIRGLPLSCGVMLRLKDLDDYEFTERVRSKVAASFSIFITEDTVESDPAKPDSILDKIEPGAIEHLSPGKKVEAFQPPTTQGYGEYVKNNLRGISSGFGMSYESLTTDYSNVNFSSGRMGWLEFYRNVEKMQWLMMVPRFCDKIYTWFLEAIQLKGYIPFSVTPTVSWTPPRREMIDPLKEMQAIKEQLRAGIISWQEIVRTFGYIPEELMEELKQDKEMWDKLGLMPTSDARFDNNRPPEELGIDPAADDEEDTPPAKKKK
jgi:lambda family phage portal protein